MGCTVQELAEKLTDREFVEWLIFMQAEQLTPDADRWRHGELLSEVANTSDMRPRGAKRWTPEHFVARDVWKPKDATLQKRKPPTPEELRAQVASLNSRRRAGK
jgi:hypothetical protein